MKAFSNGVFYTGSQIINDKSLLIENDRIIGFVTKKDIPNNCEIINLHGGNVSPGFIDIQINGYGGNFFDPTDMKKTSLEISTFFASNGVTRWMPTFISATIDTQEKIKRYCKEFIGINGIIGIHMEGPWINKNKAGVHTLENIRHWNSLDTEFSREIVTHGHLCLTMCPSQISDDDINNLINLDKVRILIGHSDVAYEEAIKFFKKGCTGVTHLFNAMTQPSSREPGIIGAALELESVCVNIIADLIHIHPTMIKLIKRSFNREAIFLISDAMPIAGSSKKEFKIHNRTCKLQGDRILDENGTLAGSAITIKEAIINLVKKIGIPLDEAIRMASLYPANFLGISHEFGRLDAGYKADFVVFTNQVEVFSSYRDGIELFTIYK